MTNQIDESYETPRNWLHTHFSFKGRLNRAPYWLSEFAIVVSLLLCGLVAAISETLGAILTIVWFIAVIWSGYAVPIKRCHDLNKSGLWLIVYMIPLIGWFWGFFELGFAKGTDGPNRFGKDPLNLYNESEYTAEYINWEIVHQVPNEMVGNIFKSVLESAGFDVLLRSHEVVAHGGLSPKPQWGDILVRSDDVERAEEIVNAYIASLSDDIIENHESDLETV